ncbi:hypothetical protein [Schleiferilactobacillus harbinensis]|uniref:Uncharacterized protein n=1 Tax=Schleiferilactobacillus harbinensis TaxID=304207 RepID=A0A5P8M455_9LACO|nr:hypothetical protein [Schleiferilactobacillus harbinensis]QFR23097.1 hypothetical protein D1010_06575 [Schleiferilactobacillus harbinensis]
MTETVKDLLEALKRDADNYQLMWKISGIKRYGRKAKLLAEIVDRVTTVENQKHCPYCHKHHVHKHLVFGQSLIAYTETYDTRGYKPRRKMLVSIANPESKHPRMKALQIFHDGAETMFDLSLKYCPYCGRKLGAKKNETVI